MDIEARAFHPRGAGVDEGRFAMIVNELMKATFDNIDEVSVERLNDVRGTKGCLSFPGFEFDSEVQEAIECALAQLIGIPYWIVTTNGELLNPKPGYQATLADVVITVSTASPNVPARATPEREQLTALG